MNDVTLAIEAIETLAQLAGQLQTLAGEVSSAMSSNDPDALKATMTKLRAANDALMVGA